MRPEQTVPTDEIDSLLAEANLLRTRGQHQEAIGACTRILQLDAGHAPAHSLLANIYQDMGNYREALGWFKLAVELNPDNEADRKKLDEMIDKVFQSALYNNQAAVRPSIGPPAAAPPNPAHKAVTPKPAPGGTRIVPPPMPPRRDAVKNLLLKIQPAHVVIATTVMALIAMLLIGLSMREPPRSARTRTQPDAVTPVNFPSDEDAAGSVTVAAPTSETTPVITPPPADQTEGGDNPLHIAVVHRTSEDPEPRPPTQTEPRVPPTTLTPDTTPAPTTNTVPPFRPSADGVTSSDEMEAQTQVLKAVLERYLKRSPLPTTTLDSLRIDPRTNSLTLEYTVPLFTKLSETKQALIYSGFHLIWSATEQNRTLTSFTLRGSAFASSDHAPSLALVADVNPQQANAARGASDYKAVADYFGNLWWRKDLAAVEL